ncbi:ABC transporter permease [Roseinatronobacter sp. NSM]|uniref:ABC transporter permease n=1 Tax=Roseinatronobacter sp. NSM TaxID=3457785 RepID=UPI004036A09D
MISYIIHRILYAIPISIGVTVFCFALVYMAPGDPLTRLLPDDASPEVVEMMKRAYGLDKPIPVQYLIWLGNALSGDLGTSIQTDRPVLNEVSKALVNTIILSAVSVVVAFSVAFVLGTVAAYYNGHAVDRLATGFSVLGVSIPNYWFGIVLIIIFSVQLRWLPATGMGPAGSGGFSLFSLDSLRHLVLPVITMALIPLGIIMRTTRSAVSEVLGQDFVQTLRAKGLNEWAVLNHAVRNALPGVLAVMGLQFGYLMGGSILVETIFTWPGTGSLLNQAILNRDIPVLQGTILVLALIFVATNLVVDLLQTAVDPRIKRT